MASSQDALSEKPVAHPDIYTTINGTMSFKKWFLLLCIEICYLLLGACFYYKIESEDEAHKRHIERVERKEIEGLLIKHYIPSINESQDDIFNKLTEYCGKPMHANMGSDEPPLVWDYYHSLFFVITVITTVGYGNLAPTTMLGRMVMMPYALAGIPVNTIIMLNLGEYFSRRLKKMYAKWKNEKIHNFTANLGLAGQVSLYVGPGIIFFIFVPAVIISIFEGWDYDVAVYYSFVTLTTIGFGDYVAGIADNHFDRTLFTAYKIFLLFWIMIGLGYLVMVFTFISRGLRSKKMHAIEEALAENIRQTPMKFKAIKTLVYEILLMRLKPVYKKSSIAPIHLQRRTMSLPDLRILSADFNSCPYRKRAVSETDTLAMPAMQRVQSDGNLHLIDKDLTFISKKEQQQHDLLRKMSAFVNSYEARLNQLNGIECFTEEEILESEQYNSEWTIGSASINKNLNISTPSLRTRTSSISKIPSGMNRNEVTWSGQTAALKEQEMRERLTYGRARSRTLPVQQGPLLRLPPPTGLINRLRRRFQSTDSYKLEKDVEKQEIAAASTPQMPQIKINRQRTQSESQNIYARNNLFTSEEQHQVDQMTKMLITILHQDDEARRQQHQSTDSTSAPDITTPRCRRTPIVPMQSRRSSLKPPSPSSHLQGRRFSLRPVDDISLPSVSPVVDRPRRYSLRPAAAMAVSSSPSPVQRQRMRKDNRGEVIIIENEQMK